MPAMGEAMVDGFVVVWRKHGKGQPLAAVYLFIISLLWKNIFSADGIRMRLLSPGCLGHAKVTLHQSSIE
jgi:hypothetical protein